VIVGIVGYGAVGSAIGSLLGPCVVFDVDEAARAAAAADGHQVVGSAAAVDCEFVCVCVRTDDEVLAVVPRLAGLALVHSTVRPETARAAGGVEAPIVGRPEVIRRGEATLLAAGDVDRALPLLSRLGRVVRVGELGTANVLKLMRNLLIGVERLALYEAALLGEAHGLRFADGLELLRTLQRDHPPLLERWERAFDPGRELQPPVGPELHLYEKDLPLALELAGRELPVTQAVAESGQRLAR
jgi:3-hydroxyisobutyrate dehydrogenase-like beta-hydroxyacid dehydrogenase